MTIENALVSLVEELEQDRSLDEPRHLRQRFEALDRLDAYLPDRQQPSIANFRSINTALQDRVRVLYSKLESANFNLYEAIRRDIQQGTGAESLLAWAPDGNTATGSVNCTGYDYLDELITGILRFEEPSADGVQLEAEMVAYQPTPARHIFDLIRRTTLSEHDLLIDLGAGLGHVSLMVSMCTKASCTGIELEPAYVDCAKKSAQSLNMNNVKFIQGDVRAADLTGSTIFYLYTPFIGAILQEVLDSLRREAATREIRISTFGPCTQVVAEEKWLSVVGPLEGERIAIFRSRN
jgi:hypothetical protein